MTDPSRDAAPPSEQSRRRSQQDRGSTVSMTSTTTGLPDRYRPLDQVGPDEPTPTGVIRCWRAKDRVLNRDVAIRVHTPAGPGRARLDHPRADRRRPGHPRPRHGLRRLRGHRRPADPRRRRLRRQRVDRRRDARRAAGPRPDARARRPHGAAAPGRGRRRGAPGRPGRRRPDHRQRRPAPQRAGRPACRARGHRHHRRRHRRARRPARGLPDRPGPGRARAATAHRPVRPGGARPPGPVHRAGSGPVQRRRHGRAAGRAAPLRARPRRRTRPAPARRRGRPTAAGSAGCATGGPTGRRPPGRAAEAAGAGGRRAPVRLDPHTLPPGAAGAPGHQAGTPLPPAAARRRHDRRRHGGAARRRLRRPARRAASPAAPTPTRTSGPTATRTTTPSACSATTTATTTTGGPATGETDIDEDGARRHRFVVIGLPLLALLVVVALAWWLGNVACCRSPATSTTSRAPRPSASAPGRAARRDAPRPRPARPIAIVGADVFDPGGDGEPENNPRTSRWPSTATRPPPGRRYEYRGSPAFGNLKDGVGLLLDLGGRSRRWPASTLTSTAPGATVEIRTGDEAGTRPGRLHRRRRRHDRGRRPSSPSTSRPPPATCWSGSPVWCRASGGFSADIAEVEVQAAG